MEDKITQNYRRLLENSTGRAVNQPRMDGYVNTMNKFNTIRDASTHYHYLPEPQIPDEFLTRYYESNGLFARIIDVPAEDAVKHGFELNGLKDEKIIRFYKEALDELEWDDAVMTALRWTRLYGGAIIVMLINDGRRLQDPVDWASIQSVDGLRVYDRSLITPDYQSMFNYSSSDPFRTRGSRMGYPEYYDVYSRFGSFRVHDSRCLVFRNGKLPENTSNTNYLLWGLPEYLRIHKAIQNTEVSHEMAPKLLDRAVQAVYKMKDLSNELSYEGGEEAVLRRLMAIDSARGLLNSIIIDAEEDYDFKTFSFTGVMDVVNVNCNLLSAVTSIPQTKLFGRSPAGENATGEADQENYNSLIDRYNRTCVRPNLRYILSAIFQAGIFTGEIDEIPKLDITFNPIWSMSEAEKAEVEARKAATAQTRAQTAQTYVDMQALDPSEVRKALAGSTEMDIESILDNLPDEEIAASPDPPVDSNAPLAAPNATRLPEDMGATATEADAENLGGVGVLVVKDGKILVGTRCSDSGTGLICGPGGHIEPGETPEEAAERETLEEFGIQPRNLFPLGVGPQEPETGIAPYIFLCTSFVGEPFSPSDEIIEPAWCSMQELDQLRPSLFQPFADSLDRLTEILEKKTSENFQIGVDKSAESGIITGDGGQGSGFPNHAGNRGHVGGSSPRGSATGANQACTGFANTKKLNGHVKKHLHQYPGMTKTQYVKHAIKFLQQPCGGDIDGYITADGKVVRFNMATGEYASGYPGSHLCTCFFAKYNDATGQSDIRKANNYFKYDKKVNAYTPPSQGTQATQPAKTASVQPARSATASKPKATAQKAKSAPRGKPKGKKAGKNKTGGNTV